MKKPFKLDPAGLFHVVPENRLSLDLSKQEKVCVQHLCCGLSFKEIAREMKISPRTVETYLERSKIKLDCHRKTELILKFIKKFS